MHIGVESMDVAKGCMNSKNSLGVVPHRGRRTATYRGTVGAHSVRGVLS